MSNKITWSKVSNAVERSSSTNIAPFPFPTVVTISLFSIFSPALYADWKLSKTSLSDKCYMAKHYELL